MHMKAFAIFLHKALYTLLKRIFGTLRKHKFIFMNKPPDIPTNAIYAVNHSCKYDVPYACEAINRPAYVLVGRQRLKLIDRIFFMINGTVWVDRKDRASRKKSMSKMLYLLGHDANVLLYPEGTWNLTPSTPVLPLYWGVTDLARQSDKPVIPVVLEYYEGECIVAFGKAVFVSASDSREEKIRELRDELAALKWQIWEKMPHIGYTSASDWQREAKRRAAEYPKLDIAYENSVIRHEFDTEETVYKPIAALEINSKTAFLAKKITEIRNRQQKQN